MTLYLNLMVHKKNSVQSQEISVVWLWKRVRRALFLQIMKKIHSTFVKKSRYLCVNWKRTGKWCCFFLLKLCCYEYCLYNGLYTHTYFFLSLSTKCEVDYMNNEYKMLIKNKKKCKNKYSKNWVMNTDQN